MARSNRTRGGALVGAALAWMVVCALGGVGVMTTAWNQLLMGGGLGPRCYIPWS